VVCCDGTWNDSDQSTDYTNVSRSPGRIKPVDAKGISQMCIPVRLGTRAPVSKIIGAATGAGLSHNCAMRIRSHLHHYCDGDEIFSSGSRARLYGALYRRSRRFAA